MSRRLLQAMAGAPHGGAETFFVRLAGALQRAGETQRVLMRPDDGRAATLAASGIAIAEARFGGLCDIASRLAFRREIARFRPDIVLTWMSRATRFCPPGDFVHLARLGGYYDLKYYRHCDYLIGNTRAIAEYAVAGGWPRDRVHFLPNFVPDPLAAPAEPAERPSDRAVALALGRLHPNKGFDFLLAALAGTLGVDLWLAGEGPERAALERLATRLGVAGRVRFLGWRDDVPSLLAAADMLVCSSRVEPLGNVVIEAWAAGVPVIATASDGPASLIEDDRTGLLAPLPEQPGSVAALALAIERLAGDADLRTRLAAAGRAAYEAEFTEANVVARYRCLFDELAA